MKNVVVIVNSPPERCFIMIYMFIIKMRTDWSHPAAISLWTTTNIWRVSFIFHRHYGDFLFAVFLLLSFFALFDAAGGEKKFELISLCEYDTFPK